MQQIQPLSNMSARQCYDATKVDVEKIAKAQVAITDNANQKSETNPKKKLDIKA